MQPSTAIARSTEHAASTFPSDELGKSFRTSSSTNLDRTRFPSGLAVENATGLDTTRGTSSKSTASCFI